MLVKCAINEFSLLIQCENDKQWLRWNKDAQSTYANKNLSYINLHYLTYSCVIHVQWIHILILVSKIKSYSMDKNKIK